MKPEFLKSLLGVQYFLYFGALGIYLPYFTLYCHQVGFSGSQIGTIASLRTAVTIIFPILWGMLADHLQKRKVIFILCNAVSVIIWGGFLVITDYYWMLAIMFLYGVFYAPIIAFLEAFTMDILGEQREGYGRIRAWGSISFILMVLILGKIIGLFGIKIILWLIFSFSLVQFLFTLNLPETSKENKGHNISYFSVISQRKLIVFLGCATLMLVCHGAYYGFFSLHLNQLGYTYVQISFAWAIATIAEIFVMLKSSWILTRINLNLIILVSFLVAALRWMVLAYVESYFYIILSQFLHAITYGAFHMASILYMDRIMPKAHKTLGQAINNSLTYGVGLSFGIFLSGLLYEHFNARTIFLFSTGIAVLGGIIFWIGVRND